MNNALTSEDVLVERRRLLAVAEDRANATLRRLASPGDEDVSTRSLTLAARAGYALAKEEDGVGSVAGIEPQHVYCARLAAERFPLPPKRVLREEPDPHGYTGLRWGCDDRAREIVVRWGSEAAWTKVADVPGGYSNALRPTAERIDLWHSLKHNPYREVPDNGDEE